MDSEGWADVVKDQSSFSKPSSAAHDNSSTDSAPETSKPSAAIASLSQPDDEKRPASQVLFGSDGQIRFPRSVFSSHLKYIAVESEESELQLVLRSRVASSSLYNHPHQSLRSYMARLGHRLALVFVPIKQSGESTLPMPAAAATSTSESPSSPAASSSSPSDSASVSSSTSSYSSMMSRELVVHERVVHQLVRGNHLIANVWLHRDKLSVHFLVVVLFFFFSSGCHFGVF